MYAYDSLLLRLDKLGENDSTSYAVASVSGKSPVKTVDFKDSVEYSLNEQNVLVLDMPEYSDDGVNYKPREEMLRIDKNLRYACLLYTSYRLQRLSFVKYVYVKAG